MQPAELPDEVVDLSMRSTAAGWSRRLPSATSPSSSGSRASSSAANSPRPLWNCWTILPDSADPELRYRLAIERGNASMRIPGRVQEARTQILDALEHARHLGSTDERALREAEAHKEMGFYYRNLGYWAEADGAYRIARDVLARVMGPGSHDTFREEMASIQTNWAYLKALRGSFRDARNLVDTAVAVRRRLGNRHLVGVSLSVSGEVYRYEANFGRAWATYQEAEAIFQETKSWPWLGTLYQEMAICLHQATRDGSTLIETRTRGDGGARSSGPWTSATSRTRAPTPRPSTGPAASTTRPVGWTRDWRASARASPRPSGSVTAGSGRPTTSSTSSTPTARGSRPANSVTATSSTSTPRRSPPSSASTGSVTSPRGGSSCKGHLLTNDGLSRRPRTVGSTRVCSTTAIDRYSLGFRMLADESVGSHGSAAIAREFTRFRALFDRLPSAIQRRWYKKLSVDWNAGDPTKTSISLLARLEELY